MQTFPILVDLGLMVVAAAVLLLLGRPLRVPPILTYMVAGLMLGPVAGVTGPGESIELMSRLGVALLLFLVGLSLSLGRIREVGWPVVTTGLGQVVATVLLGTGLAAVLGFSRQDALLVALGITSSSTVVIVKLLEGLGGVASSQGRLAIGVSLIQDLSVALAITLLGGLGGGAEGAGGIGLAVFRSFAGIAVLGLVAWAAVRRLLPSLIRSIAARRETLLVVSLSWCFAFIVAAETLGISIELGAFVAGLALAQLPYGEELARRVQPLADFFLAVFFVSLGAGMDMGAALALWPQALALSVFVLLVKPLLVAALLVRTRYGRRTAFLAAAAHGQVSEFGFILMALALSAGMVESAGLPALLGLVGLVTIGVSVALTPFAPALWTRLERRLPGGPEPTEAAPPPLAGHIVVVGMNTLGRRLVHRLAERGERVVAVDSDPGKLTALPAITVFGNADSSAALEEAGVARAKLVIAAPQIEDANALLAYRCRRLGVPVCVHAFDPDLIDELLEIGADYLMMSKLDGIRLVEEELRRLGVTG